jgi:hypothetical protein
MPIAGRKHFESVDQPTITVFSLQTVQVGSSTDFHSPPEIPAVITGTWLFNFGSAKFLCL